jgi:hypothetical protein
MDDTSVSRALMDNRDMHEASGARSLMFVLLQLSDSRLEQSCNGERSITNVLDMLRGKVSAALEGSLDKGARSDTNVCEISSDIRAWHEVRAEISKILKQLQSRSVRAMQPSSPARSRTSVQLISKFLSLVQDERGARSLTLDLHIHKLSILEGIPSSEEKKSISMIDS